jgi:Co/Zn/Cd efflux system component
MNVLQFHEEIKMPGCSTCHDHQPAQSVSPTYKKVLWVALVVNLGMFIVEVASGLKAGSVGGFT